MVFFTDVQPTEHYLENHAKDVPWDKVVEIIFSTKNPRKKEVNSRLRVMVIMCFLK